MAPPSSSNLQKMIYGNVKRMLFGNAPLRPCFFSHAFHMCSHLLSTSTLLAMVSCCPRLHNWVSYCPCSLPPQQNHGAFSLSCTWSAFYWAVSTACSHGTLLPTATRCPIACFPLAALVAWHIFLSTPWLCALRLGDYALQPMALHPMVCAMWPCFLAFMAFLAEINHG